MNYYETVLTSVRVRPNDLDSLGHVNNASVLEYFELARWDWMDQFQLRQDSKILPVVASIQVDYRAEIRPGVVEVTTELEQSDKSFAYQVFFVQTMTQSHEGNARLTAQGKIKVAFIHAETRRLCSLDEFLSTNQDPVFHKDRESQEKQHELATS